MGTSTAPVLLSILDLVSGEATYLPPHLSTIETATVLEGTAPTGCNSVETTYKSSYSADAVLEPTF